jgi:uncharacterized protein (TIGR03435 family)
MELENACGEHMTHGIAFRTSTPIRTAIRPRAEVVLGMAIFVGTLSAPFLLAQPPSTNTTSSPAFDQASINLNTSGDRTLGNDPNVHVSRSAGGICSSWGWLRDSETCFVASNVALRELIAYAYGSTGLIPPLPQIADVPSDIDSDRFDIVGRVAGNAPLEPFSDPQLAPLVRRLLADRFKLALHHETHALSVYRLVLARSDRQTGPLLRPATPDCAATVDATRSDSGRLSLHNRCTVAESGRGYLKGDAIGMSQLARVLSNRLGQVVRDETGLAGLFRIDFTWDADRARNGPSLFSALQEQLGLRLEATDGLVDVLVIDHVERPKAN